MEGEGETEVVGRSRPGRQSKCCQQTKARHPMDTVLNEQSHWEVVSQTGASIDCLSRASKAQMSCLIRTEATPPRSHCGRTWPGSKLKMTTICQDRALVVGHAKGGRNTGKPDFLSRYNSRANRSQGHIYRAQGTCLHKEGRSRSLLQSRAKTEGQGTMDSS